MAKATPASGRSCRNGARREAAGRAIGMPASLWPIRPQWSPPLGGGTTTPLILGTTTLLVPHGARR